MNQSGYLGLDTLQTNLPYDGGICKWYYAALEDVATWPTIDSTTQELTSYPTLLTGKTWKGPVKVPNNYLGFKEVQKSVAAGIYYDQSLEFHQAGDNRTNRQIVENMPYYQYIVVGKVRAGGFWILLGNPEVGLKLSNTTDFGKGQFATAKTDFILSIKSQYKALVIPSFAGDNSDSADGSTTPTTAAANDVEQINYTTDNTTTTVTINWTTSRLKRFGIFPLIEVWSNETGTYKLDTAPNIFYDDSGATPVFTIDRTGADTGFIIIK